MRRFCNILFLLILSFLGLSCIRESFKDDSDEQKGFVSFQVDYRPLESVLDDGTKSPGDLIRTIDNLSIIVYIASDGTYYTSKYFTKGEFSLSEIASPQGKFAESKVWRAKFGFEIPKGRYRIYAVANMDRELTADEMKDEDALKSISLSWKADSNNAATTDDNKMFGFFTDNEDVEIPSSAPDITIASVDVSLHAWVKRTVSKVTVSYDASALNDNVYIYLKSVQILDIPNKCFLGKSNSPSSASDIIHEGEMISYSSSSNFLDWPRITKGNPLYGSDHSETAQAMYLFENNQGEGEKHNYHPDDPSWDKDKKTFGSYIEVKAYYINRSELNSSHGDIIYRFMLGQDVTKDFNAERNNHYKITLKFKNDANNPDWHIVYDPVDPELKVPDIMYISYGYNKSLDIPAVVIGGTSSNISATITHNPWWYEGHKYANDPKNNAPSNGFLNLQPDTKVTNTDRTGSYLSNKNDYTPKNQLDAGVDLYTVPVYTRPLVLGASYSGYNYYENHRKQAEVEIKATVNVNGATKTITKKVSVIQVERLLNPAGIWRRSDNDAEFAVTLTKLSGDATDFDKLVSEGPWTAHILQGSDWVRIKSKSDGAVWGTSDVTGATGSVIEFDYKPNGTIGASDSRCGIIEVTYHNNTCTHYIFVRQGYAPMKIGNYTWHSFNMWHYCKEVSSPCSEGCMFKFGNSKIPLKPQNNFREGFKVHQSPSSDAYFIQDNGVNRKWKDFKAINTGFTAADGSNSEMWYGSGHPATYQHWSDLDVKCNREYGVLYDDACTETKMNVHDAYEFLCDDSEANPVHPSKGMRGVFVYELSTGKNLFFPIGATGHGHRQKHNYVGSGVTLKSNGDYDDSDRYKYAKFRVLQYAQRQQEMPTEYAKERPMYYDIYKNLGAIYFYRTPRETQKVAWDINFTTAGFSDYDKNAYTGEGDALDYGSVQSTEGKQDSDMGFVRCVED